MTALCFFALVVESFVAEGYQVDAQEEPLPATTTATITATATAEATAPSVLQHEVQAGETLFAIAERYGVTVAVIMAENGLTDADAITIGQQLLLPAGAAQQPTREPLPVHVVQPGETLSEIAQRYDLSLMRLMLFNGLNDADALLVGQELAIPAAEGAPDASVDTADSVVITEATPLPSPTPTAAVPTPLAASDEITSSRPIEQTTARQGEAAPIAMQTALLEPEAVAAQIASQNRFYTVRKGDTFARIALRTGVDPEALRQLNRLDPERLNDLNIGQQLRLPATGDELLVRQPAREYVVQPGDSLGSIANQFELSLADLLAANYIADPDALAIGQRLTIPQASAEELQAKLPAKVGPARRGFYYYTVQTGDTLSELARAFQSSKLALLEYNGLPDEQTVFSGIELRIPYGPPALTYRRPPVPSSGTSFVVSLSRQQCWLFQGDTITHEWTCSTGYGEWITRTGAFAVQSKIEMAQSSAYRLDMPYWLGIYNVGAYENGIHGLPVDWDTGEKIWEGLIGEPATFGCAMLDDPDAALLFATAYIGMPVHVTN